MSIATPIQPSPVRIVIQNTILLEKVSTEHGSDFYAMWDPKRGWNDSEWVRVRQDAPASQVEDTFFRGEFVTSL